MEKMVKRTIDMEVGFGELEGRGLGWMEEEEIMDQAMGRLRRENQDIEIQLGPLDTIKLEIDDLAKLNDSIKAEADLVKTQLEFYGVYLEIPLSSGRGEGAFELDGRLGFLGKRSEDRISVIRTPVVIHRKSSIIKYETSSQKYETSSQKYFSNSKRSFNLSQSKGSYHSININDKILDAIPEKARRGSSKGVSERKILDKMRRSIASMCQEEHSTGPKVENFWSESRKKSSSRKHIGGGTSGKKRKVPEVVCVETSPERRVLFGGGKSSSPSHKFQNTTAGSKESPLRSTKLKQLLGQQEYNSPVKKRKKQSKSRSKRKPNRKPSNPEMHSDGMFTFSPIRMPEGWDFRDIHQIEAELSEPAENPVKSPHFITFANSALKNISRSFIDDNLASNKVRPKPRPSLHSKSPPSYSGYRQRSKSKSKSRSRPEVIETSPFRDDIEQNSYFEFPRSPGNFSPTRKLKIKNQKSQTSQ
jgi:hypothetical protein